MLRLNSLRNPFGTKISAIMQQHEDFLLHNLNTRFPGRQKTPNNEVAFHEVCVLDDYLNRFLNWFFILFVVITVKATGLRKKSNHASEFPCLFVASISCPTGSGKQPHILKERFNPDAYLESNEHEIVSTTEQIKMQQIAFGAVLIGSQLPGLILTWTPRIYRGHHNSSTYPIQLDLCKTQNAAANKIDYFFESYLCLFSLIFL